MIVKPCYYDDIDMIEKLSDGNFYSKSYFTSRFMEKKVKLVDVDVPITKQDNDDQNQLHFEAL